MAIEMLNEREIKPGYKVLIEEVEIKFKNNFTY